MLKVTVIGYLGKDAIVNDVNGKKVINFSVAHTEKFTDAKGVKQESTTWVDCAKWGDNVAVAPYLKKGTLVYVEGNPEIRQYQRKDGTSGVSLSCRVGTIQLLGGKNDAGSNAAPAATPADKASNGAAPAADTGGLPF